MPSEREPFFDRPTDRPDWTLPASACTVWLEDDADVSCRGHEGLADAWRRFTGSAVIPAPVEEWDAGDAFYKRLPDGHVLIESYPGNSEIRLLRLDGGPPRSCTRCGERAFFVAADAHGLEWFECGNHRRWDNVAGVERTRLVPLVKWFKDRGLGWPGSETP
jgi:hypothetical protein